MLSDSPVQRVSIPETLARLVALEGIRISACIKELPWTINQLRNLRELDLSQCYHLKTLPDGITSLTNLQTLRLSGRFEVFPVSICSLENLRRLTWSGCGWKEIPKEIEKLSNLRHLSLTVFLEVDKSESQQHRRDNPVHGVTKILEAIQNLRQLRSLTLRGWTNDRECTTKYIANFAELE